MEDKYQKKSDRYRLQAFVLQAFFVFDFYLQIIMVRCRKKLQQDLERSNDGHIERSIGPNILVFSF